MMTTLLFNFTENKTYMTTLLYSAIYLSECRWLSDKYSCALSFLQDSRYKNFQIFNISYFFKIIYGALCLKQFKCLTF